MFLTLSSLIFKMFLPTGVTYVLFRFGRIRAEDKDTIVKLVMKIFVFFTIFMSSQQDFSAKDARNIFMTGLITALFFLVSIPATKLLTKRLKLEDDHARIFLSSAVFDNIGFVGFPVVLELYGQQALLCAIMYHMVFSLIFFTYGLINLKAINGSKLKAIVTNPYTITCVVTLTFYFLQIKLPEPIYSAFDAMADATMPLVMVYTGVLLAQAGIKNILLDREAYLPVFIRLIAMPLAVFVILKLVGCGPYLLRINTLLAALPCGTITAIIASERDCQPEYASNIMVLSNLIMLLTIPLWILIIGA